MYFKRIPDERRHVDPNVIQKVESSGNIFLHIKNLTQPIWIIHVTRKRWDLPNDLCTEEIEEIYILFHYLTENSDYFFTQIQTPNQSLFMVAGGYWRHFGLTKCRFLAEQSGAIVTH